MSTYPAFTDHTEEEFDRQDLTGNFVEPPDDETYAVQLQRLAKQINAYATQVPYRHRLAAIAYSHGNPPKDIAAKHNMHVMTVYKALKTPKVLHLLQLMAELAELRGGPSLETRRAMLWRIAKWAEQANPALAVRTVDTLNKQAGDYNLTPEEQKQAGLTINVVQYDPTTISAPPPRVQQDLDQPVTLEGTFQPVPMELP